MLAPARALPAAHFSDITAQAPDFQSLSLQYAEIGASLDRSTTVEGALEAFERWDTLRRSLDTWSSLTDLQFRRYTSDPEFKEAVDILNELRPKITGLDVDLKRTFLASELRGELERHLGAYLFARWEKDVSAYEPAIESLSVEESRLCDRYMALLANAAIPFRGEQLTLTTIVKYAEHSDRARREEAECARWSCYAAHAEQLDGIYDELVHLRHRMARKLHLETFTELGYRRMRRTDYGPAEVARWREEIAREIVPLAERIVRAQARDIGTEDVMIWDERVFSKSGPPQPPQAYGDMLSAARVAFEGIDTEIGGFARMMMERELLDLQAREGKAGGGFCTAFPAYGLPYVFANFNGTTGDVNVLLHEIGHAFQNYSSRGIGVLDYLWPTSEACEVHSMSMEFLAWPQLERFFGDRAEEYRIDHLKSSLLFLPYGAAIDHFQHLVYEHPDASPAERHGFWKQMEAAYLPWRRYGGIEFLEKGAFWQKQLHVYIHPFYYIDYTLALCCALQLWARSQDDYKSALGDYTQLCKRGGQLPFQQLVRSANIQSPFEAGVLAGVAKRASEIVGV